MSTSPEDILTFWRNAGPGKWFKKDPTFDDAVRARFEAAHHAAARGEYESWEETAEGCAALLILLDQFPRNLYRGSAHAFATDPQARRIASFAVNRGFDRQIGEDLRLFFYLPFEHSEDPADQAKGVALTRAMGNDEYLKFAILHQDIIERFGRFPHRNTALGRRTTEAEQAFLDEGGFSG